MTISIVKEIGSKTSVKVDASREYLAAGVMQTASQGRRVLPALSTDFNDLPANIVDEMLNDPEIAKCHQYLKIATLGDGVQLLPSINESEMYYEESVAIRDFCTEAIQSMELPLQEVLDQMMDGIVYGHKIAEIVYKLAPVHGFTGEFLVLDKIKVKSRYMAQFVVDNKLNVLGIVGRGIYGVDGFPTATKGGTAGAIIGEVGKNMDEIYGNKNTNTQDISITENAAGDVFINGSPILPRDKFMIFTFRSKDGDPRGCSILRPAYNCWNLKTQLWPEYLRYLLMCAIPLLVGFTPENEAMKELQRDKNGDPVRDSEGRWIEANPVEALRDALVQARNATTLALKGGSSIKEIGATNGGGVAFYKAIEVFDDQIETGVLLQTLATSAGAHQSKAAAQTHMSVLDQLVWRLKGIVINMLVTDLLRPLIKFNFGDDALEFTPTVSLGDTERREFATDATAISMLYKAGYLQADQLKQTDSMLGLGVRKTTDPLQLVQQLQAAGIPIIAIPPDPQVAAQIAAGSGGGTTPVPVGPSGSVVPTGTRADSQQGLPNTKPVKSSSSAVKFPAAGRVKSKINSSPKNMQLPSNPKPNTAPAESTGVHDILKQVGG